LQVLCAPAGAILAEIHHPSAPGATFTLSRLSGRDAAFRTNTVEGGPLCSHSFYVSWHSLETCGEIIRHRRFKSPVLHLEMPGWPGKTVFPGRHSFLASLSGIFPWHLVTMPIHVAARNSNNLPKTEGLPRLLHPRSPSSRASPPPPTSPLFSTQLAITGAITGGAEPSYIVTSRCSRTKALARHAAASRCASRRPADAAPARPAASSPARPAALLLRCRRGRCRALQVLHQLALA
jgi:hypothetical protein